MRKVICGLVLASMAVVAATSTSSATAGGGPGSPPTETPDATDILAAQQLARDYGVSGESAMRIIAREDELVAISDEAALELGSTWAGASFTIQNDTPTLHMYSTSEDAAFKYINSISRAEAASDVKIESASYSLANLNKIRLEISDKLASPFVTIPPVVSSISVDIPSKPGSRRDAS